MTAGFNAPGDFLVCYATMMIHTISRFIIHLIAKVRFNSPASILFCGIEVAFLMSFCAPFLFSAGISQGYSLARTLSD